MKDIIKIAITGGPCGGKTKAINWMKEHFTGKGYAVIVVPETATELISSGIAPWTCGTVQNFQRIVLKLQLAKEKLYQEGASYQQQDRVLMILDRGVMDGKVYISDDEFKEIIDEVGITEEEIISRYDAVFHMISAAKGEPKHYSSRSNGARTESIEEAAKLDDKILTAWSAHPQHRIIGTTANVNEKVVELEKEIQAFLCGDLK